MVRKIQNEALAEIIKASEIIVAVKNEEMAQKVAEVLGINLWHAGVRSHEASVLFELAGEKITYGDGDDETVILMGMDKDETTDDE